jgi:hypothetical protein
VGEEGEREQPLKAGDAGSGRRPKEGLLHRLADRDVVRGDAHEGVVMGARTKEAKKGGKRREEGKTRITSLVPVVVGLVGASNREREVVGLDLGHGRQLDVELGQVGAGDLLVEGLGEDVNAERVLLRLGPKSDLGL